jgi:hypothetical protein
VANGSDVAEPTQEAKAATRQSQAATLNQLSAPVVAIGLVICVAMLIAFSGIALLRDRMDSTGFGAIAAYLFGALSTLLGVQAGRQPQRANDTSSTTATATPGTNGSGSATVTVKP